MPGDLVSENSLIIRQDTGYLQASQTPFTFSEPAWTSAPVQVSQPLSAQGGYSEVGRLLDVCCSSRNSEPNQTTYLAERLRNVLVNTKRPSNFKQVDPRLDFPNMLGSWLVHHEEPRRDRENLFSHSKKPANFDSHLAECERVLAGVKSQVGLLDIRSVEQDVVQSQLDQCMVGSNLTGRKIGEWMFFTWLLFPVLVKQKLYKILSEAKGEVEMVIKTGRQIVQRQQTQQPKELDDRVTALKLLYNQLGSQVTESKLELEKSLKLSRKLRKELNGLTEWLATTDAELTRRSAVEGMPRDLEAEVTWAQVLRAELEMTKGKMEEVRDLAQELMSTRGENCQAQDLRILRNRKALAIAPQWYQYRRKSHDLMAWLDDIQRSVDQLPDPPEGERVKVKACSEP
ncbi:hypothetical protein XENOCAPTIV_012162 [Xenoophorus captivus]|uniref:Dystrophin n=1 Tax=Xenoophorus captivus TaxID=1517983 RepID=A0ABV0QWJ8_9TELE